MRVHLDTDFGGDRAARRPGDWDPVACAVALRWAGARVESMRLAPRLGQDGVLRFEPGESARDMRVVTEVDGDAFAELWLSSVEALLR